ncbi:hypothetical protein JFQ93_004146 [Aeromonas sobria]|nr:hypothetical protein [Aeromonas sobria]
MEYRIFEGNYLLRLDELLRMLPNVKPRKAREVIKAWQHELFDKILINSCSDAEKEYHEIEVSDNLTLKASDFEHIFFDCESSAKRITPYGAQIVCQAYKEGLFETKTRMSEFLIPSEVQEYIGSTDSIISKQNANNLLRQKERDEYEKKISNVESINENEFSYTLLSDVFSKKIGFKGTCCVLEIGRIKVTKSLSLYRSNSGRSSDWQVTFSWLGSDGKYKTLRKNSIYSENRRNDADRNYGLHE